MKTPLLKLTAAALLAGLVVSTASAQTPPVLDLQRAGGGLQLRWRTPAAAPDGRLPSLQLETSDDLQQWAPRGQAIRPASADELHLRSFTGDRARAWKCAGTEAPKLPSHFLGLLKAKRRMSSWKRLAPTS